ncbi:MAG: nucleotidyltransferase domain-containing protein [Candidatus Abyssobacteria bacterium SURF_17]|uniref:Nucleotidyltransferase domain-containing protein n=1 Tax=Candidatus Abyssobacteria bacterium SURF_17 TaxID=2093361 RepID=A0A419EV47_9BACT|nr:MAG: nucleotidyltransferase domain-containing protein [Candidatus Abyssubacteria bacterium SURF_17]
MSIETKAIVTELREQLELIYGKRLVQMILFGSQARGEACPGSDIDVMVVLQGPVRPGEEIARAGGITSALSLKYDVVISCTFLSEERYKHEQSPLLLNVRREGVVA